MPTVYDVPPDLLIKRLAEHLKKMPQIQPPTWSIYVKTGPHAERLPQNRDWWYYRCASLLRKIYIHGPIGLTELMSMYGGRKQIGYRLAHHRNAGSSIIRKALIQLQSIGLVRKTPKGRIITTEGRSLLDRLSSEIFKEVAKENPELAKLV